MEWGATFLQLLATYLLLNYTAAELTKILAVGDSMAEFMGQTLESFCEESKVYNAGIGGTTAEQWSSYSQDDIVDCGEDWDVVYISVGGNDLLESGCTLKPSTLTSRIEDAVANVVQNIAPGAKTYILTGYCIPAGPEGDEEETACSDPSGYESMSVAIRNISTDSLGLPPNSSLQVFDSSTICGGSSNSFSNADYFQDPIHLNAKGYCKVFTQGSIQSSMQCENVDEEFNCESLDDDGIFGLENNCVSSESGSMSSGAKLFSVKLVSVLISVLIFRLL